jgi:hypothetical protein
VQRGHGDPRAASNTPATRHPRLAALAGLPSAKKVATAAVEGDVPPPASGGGKKRTTRL